MVARDLSGITTPKRPRVASTTQHAIDEQMERLRDRPTKAQSDESEDGAA